MHHHHHIGGYTTYTPTHTHAHTRPPDSPAIISCGEVSSYITTPPQSPWCREIDLGIPKQALFLAVGSGGPHWMIMLTFCSLIFVEYGEKHEKNECATSHPFGGCFRKVATNRATLCVFVIFGGVMIKR